jgi:heterodisulfide reductase subunit A
MLRGRYIDDMRKNGVGGKDPRSKQPLKRRPLSKENVVAEVLVIGGGIAGIQASLDLADMGVKVYMVERRPSIGGVMAQLDKTFPTNDCSI